MNSLKLNIRCRSLSRGYKQLAAQRQTERIRNGGTEREVSGGKNSRPSDVAWLSASSSNSHTYTLTSPLLYQLLSHNPYQQQQQNYFIPLLLLFVKLTSRVSAALTYHLCSSCFKFSISKSNLAVRPSAHTWAAQRHDTMMTTNIQQQQQQWKRTKRCASFRARRSNFVILSFWLFRVGSNWHHKVGGNGQGKVKGSEDQALQAIAPVGMTALLPAWPS